MKNYIIVFLSGLVAFQFFNHKPAADLSLHKKEREYSSASLRGGEQSEAEAKSAGVECSSPFAQNLLGFGDASLSQESFLQHMKISLEKYKSLDKLGFAFLASDFKGNPQGPQYFRYMAEWLQPQLQETDALLWQSFAKEWVKLDKEAVREYLAKAEITGDFSDVLNTSLLSSDIQENPAPYLNRLLSSQNDAANYFATSAIIEEAYRTKGPGFRGEILSARGSLTPQASEDYLSSFYASVWEVEKTNAPQVLEQIFASHDFQASEIPLMLNTGYLKNRDEFLKWFRDYAPKTADSSLAANFYKSYESMNESDKQWLLQSPSFKSFDALRSP